MKDLKSKAQELASYGRNGDTMLAHITPQEAQLLKSVGGSGTINPDTGLPEYFLGALIGGGLSLLGGLAGAKSAKSAANTQANAQLEAARIAAEEARFRPVAITTGFGKSQFTTDPEGRVTGAGYELTPEMQALRNQLIQQAQQQGLGLTQQGLGAAQGLFGLGQQYLAQSPEQAAQQWMATQQALLAPQREQALSGIMNKLAQTGTQGLGVAQAGGGAANPALQAYFNSVALQDRANAAEAMAQGRAQTQFGTGLFSDAFKLAQGGYGPLSTQLAQAQGIEQLGQGALDLGTAIGQKITTANTNAGNLLATGAANAAQTLGRVQGYSPVGSTLMGLGQNPQFTNAAGQWVSGLFNQPTGTTFAGNSPADFDYAYGGGGWY